MVEKQILLCTHGKFGEEIIKSAEMIIGKMDHVRAFSLLPGMDPFAYGEQIAQYIGEHPSVEFLCIVDLYGGTPSNMLAAQLRNYPIQVISGLNLAMLIEAYSQVNFKSMKELCECALATLRNSGYDINQQLQMMMQKKEGE